MADIYILISNVLGPILDVKNIDQKQYFNRCVSNPKIDIDVPCDILVLIDTPHILQSIFKISTG